MLSEEQRLLKEAIRILKPEAAIGGWLADHANQFSPIVVDGFEKRAEGLLKAICERNFKIEKLAVLYYEQNGIDENYSKKRQELLEKLGVREIKYFPLDQFERNMGHILTFLERSELLVDITGVSNSLLFNLIDSLIEQDRPVSLAYTEASEYWPKREEWRELKKEMRDPELLSQAVDEKPWLFAGEHEVSLVNGYEGYDSASSRRAFMGFLPFKCSRIAAILSEEEYAKHFFIAGIPRLKENLWRLNAVKEINFPILRGSELLKMPTFGYKNTAESLGTYLQKRVINDFDVHLALLGSKLQNVGCWVVLQCIGGITAITSRPKDYFEHSFSDGIGKTWIIPDINLIKSK